jgi:hypothetical protein
MACNATAELVSYYLWIIDYQYQCINKTYAVSDEDVSIRKTAMMHRRMVLQAKALSRRCHRRDNPGPYGGE